MEGLEAHENLLSVLNENISPFLLNQRSAYDHLLKMIGNSRIVLMGEATHGTSEFYQARIELTKYLIQEKNFHALAIEGDWTSTYPVHAYLQGQGKADAARSALASFKRFPSWMWRNTEILSFLKWLREYNDQANSQKRKIGLYGLDLYCLNESIEALIDYLKTIDPLAANEAIQRYSCFDHCSLDPHTYGYLIESGVKKNCLKEVTEQLLDVQRSAFDKMHQNAYTESESEFYALQNARVVKNAEHYYRALYESNQLTWNIRDQHMVESLHNLMTHLETVHQIPAKVIIWAHNSHVGDARATEMSSRSEVNLGQLVREQFASISFHLGFSTYTGTVTAASEWGSAPETKKIVPGFKESYEELFHSLAQKNFTLNLHGRNRIYHLLKPARLQRAIGVIYRPETERLSHYFFTHLPYQFDALIHIDTSKALKPLDL